MIYLIGPYTSVTRQEYRFNMGRFISYYMYLKMCTTDPIVCYPLMTHGFELATKIPEDTYLKRCKELIMGCRPACAFVPGWESSYGSREEFTLAHFHNLEMMFPEMTPVIIDDVFNELVKIRDRNALAQYGMDYIKFVKTTRGDDEHNRDDQTS